jgi:multimeric flavodoxin WrbA
VGRRHRVRDADPLRQRRGAVEGFPDLAGELWERGALVDKVATSFTSSQTEHGGQESTILALNNTLYQRGAIVLPLGHTVHEAFARAQGARLERVTAAIAAAREAGLLTAKATAKSSSLNGKEN